MTVEEQQGRGVLDADDSDESRIFLLWTGPVYQVQLSYCS